MDDITLLVGRNLKKLRSKHDLSLDAISEATGISKAMLSQIERGKSNPTVSTLWKIATGLKVPFSTFMEQDDLRYEIISADTLTPVLECDGLMKIYSFFPFDANKHFEILSIELQPGAAHHSPNHADGVEEYIFVFAGTLQIGLGEEKITLRTGQALKFLANQPHAYANTQDTLCRFQNLIVYQK
jgi:XRE family transcriptional regulator, regulator of sulfur utilization